MEKKRDKSSLTVSTLWLWLALHSVTGWKETGSPRTVVFPLWIDMDHIRTWWEGWVQVAERGEVGNKKGIGVAKEMGDIEGSQHCPHVHAEDKSSSSCKRALDHMDVEGDGNHCISSAFFAHASWRFFHLHFPHFSMFLATDILKSWTNGCGEHTNWLHSEHAGSTHGAAAAARPVSICTAHVHQGWGTAWLLGWDTEPGHPAAPLEQVEMWLSQEDLLEQSWITGGKGLRLLCVAAGSLGRGGPSWWGGKWAAEVSRMEVLLCV